MPLECDRWKADVTCMQDDRTAMAETIVAKEEMPGFRDMDRRLSEFVQSDMVEADDECEESWCRRR